ncbi:MAG: class I SAM-dependent methyltransferase [Actinobacteria bacterium]|nr:class I SAM-dependent methyltransferase [Actinomycetota bacterium]
MEHSQDNVAGVRGFFNEEVRKHPSFLLDDRDPTNFLIPSEEYARDLLGVCDDSLDILEIGCGDGVDSIRLAATSNRVCAIDLAENRIAQAQGNISRNGLSERITARHMDAHDLDFPDGHFDLVIGNSVLLFLDRKRFARECYRVLKPGGRAIFPNESMADHPLLRLRRSLPGVNQREEVADRMTLSGVEAIAADFDSARHREFYLFSVLLAPVVSRHGRKRAVAGAVRLAYRLDESILHRFKGLRKYCWISVIELKKTTGNR